MAGETQFLPLTETIAPADEAAVSAALAEACGQQTAVYPLGGGTSLDYGLRPARPGLGLSLGGLNRVVDYPSADMTITVEAGMTFANLQRRLAIKKQWLPLEAGHPDRATIGGIVATNTFGPRRYAYGTIRDYLLGARAVDGRGEAYSGGGRVVKNAAGYNMPRVLAGSLGTLGVITQVTLMVRPVPVSSAVLMCDVVDFEQAECLLAALSHSQTFPVAIELLSGAVRSGGPFMPPAGESRARLLVGFDGSAAEVDWMIRRLSAEWREAGAHLMTTIAGAAVDTLWQWLGDFDATLQIDIFPSALVRVVEELLARLPGAAIQAHAGNGVIQVAVPAGDGVPLGSLLRESVRPLVASAGGNLVVLATPAEGTLTAADVWGPVRPAAAAMRAMQESFDPAGILNPGRYVFGSST